LHKLENRYLLPNSNVEVNLIENLDGSFSKFTQGKLTHEKSLNRRNGNMSITETSSVMTKKTEDGNKFINQYMVIKDLGR